MRAASLLLLLWCVPVSAAEPMVGVAAGHIGIHDGATNPGWFGVEVHWGPVTTLEVTPGAGLYHAADGASYLWISLRRTHWLSNRWAFVPSFGPGIFHSSPQFQLGYRIQFRSSVELVYRLDSGARLGFGVAHLSNAELGDTNPGTETATFTFTLPLRTSR